MPAEEIAKKQKYTQIGGFFLGFPKSKELPPNDSDEKGFYVSAIGTDNTSTSATANKIEKFLKSNFGLPAVEVFSLVFILSRIRAYASMHDRKTHMHGVVFFFPGATNKSKSWGCHNTEFHAAQKQKQKENNLIKLNHRTRYDSIR